MSQPGTSPGYPLHGPRPPAVGGAGVADLASWGALAEGPGSVTGVTGLSSSPSSMSSSSPLRRTKAELDRSGPARSAESSWSSQPRSPVRQGATPGGTRPAEPGEPRGQDPSPAFRPPSSESQEEAPEPALAWPSQSQLSPHPWPLGPPAVLPRVQRSGLSILRKRSSEPGVWVPSGTPYPRRLL